MVAHLVVAGTSSGVGKTTITVGLLRALQARGLRVVAFKCGPDYLDPSYHARAAGAPCHNLDGWIMGQNAVAATFAHAARGADIALIEGMMGLFEGASPTGDEGSTAEIARWLGAPVLVVCDASGMARSLAALARGFAAFDPHITIAGIVANTSTTMTTCPARATRRRAGALLAGPRCSPARRRWAVPWRRLRRGARRQRRPACRDRGVRPGRGRSTPSAAA
jgi:cobyrinic acid a,c-diamide synthase